MRIYLSSLGCKLNQSEMDALAGRFAQGGHEIVASAAQADLCILNTCTVTHVAAQKSRQALRRLHRQNPQARLVATGCYAELTPDDLRDLPGVGDSKRLSRGARERLFPRILESADWAAICVSAEEVDRRNVLAASLWGMERAVSRLRHPPDLVLVDGNRLPPGLVSRGMAVVKGDGRSQSIAAASIVAKVLRDGIMRRWDRHYPGYGFARNVGYPTREHQEALRRLGPCPLHRHSFAPVAAVLSRLPLQEDSAAAR